ncbi:hypothetical protein KKC1_02520 [Calderihabitans maritimus]|uniref:Uncharacterized protein n=1 Tax=Calderihabitans maritimus TaxID=1246530 RepID=A0A1Z5HP86_9FIRM|nr:hypothetical protein KKC1_02520 [Calderihabitans maritimus]
MKSTPFTLAFGRLAGMTKIIPAYEKQILTGDPGSELLWSPHL